MESTLNMLTPGTLPRHAINVGKLINHKEKVTNMCVPVGILTMQTLMLPKTLEIK